MTFDEAYIGLYQLGFNNCWLSGNIFFNVMITLLSQTDFRLSSEDTFFRIDFLTGIAEDNRFNKVKLDVSEHTLMLVANLPVPEPFDWLAWTKEQFEIAITERDPEGGHRDCDHAMLQYCVATQPDFIELATGFTEMERWYS